MPSSEQLLLEKRYLDACYAGNVETIEYMLETERRLLNDSFLSKCFSRICDGGDGGNYLEIFRIILTYITVRKFDTLGRIVDYACIKGRLEIVMHWFETETYDQFHLIEMLNKSCESGNANLIKFVLNKVDKSDNADYAYNKNICCQIACKSGNMESVEIFNNCDNSDDHLNECLKNACIGGNIKIVEFIMLNGGSNYNDCMFSAGLGGNINIIKLLLELQLENDMITSTTFNDCVHGACIGNHMEVIKLYITQLDVPNIEKCINIACKSGNLEIIKYMVTQGTSDWNSYASACLNYTNGQNCTEILEFLISKGATNYDEYLYFMCFHNKINVVESLVKKGATNWERGLQGACLGSNVELVRKMIEYGATDLNDGLRSAYCANDIDTDNIFIILLANGANQYDYLCRTNNFKLYCIWLKHKGLKPSDKRWLYLYKRHPPCVLLTSRISINHKCHIRKLPVELFTLLNQY